MLFEYFRVFSYNGATLNDLSLANQDKSSNLSLNLSTTDYLYFSQYYPFTHLFFHIETGNDQASNIVLEYWDGTQWREFRNVLDGTKSGSNTLSKSGHISFSTDDDYNWYAIPDTEELSSPTELQGIQILDHYWMRVSTSASTNALSTAKEIGYAFTSTQQLNDIDTDISNWYNAFETSKSDWINEIKLASKLLVNDLKRKHKIRNRGELVYMEDVSLACDYKTLEIIYRNLGEPYRQKMLDSRKEYTAMITHPLTLDNDLDGRIDKNELAASIYTGKR